MSINKLLNSNCLGVVCKKTICFNASFSRQVIYQNLPDINGNFWVCANRSIKCKDEDQYGWPTCAVIQTWYTQLKRSYESAIFGRIWQIAYHEKLYWLTFTLTVENVTYCHISNCTCVLIIFPHIFNEKKHTIRCYTMQYHIFQYFTKVKANWSWPIFLLWLE